MMFLNRSLKLKFFHSTKLCFNSGVRVMDFHKYFHQNLLKTSGKGGTVRTWPRCAWLKALQNSKVCGSISSLNGNMSQFIRCSETLLNFKRIYIYIQRIEMN